MAWIIMNRKPHLIRLVLIFIPLLLGQSLLTHSISSAYEWSLGEKSRFYLAGHMKSLNYIQKFPLQDEYQGLTDTQIRFDLKAAWPEHFELAYSQEADLLVGEGSRSLLSDSPFDLFDLNSTPIESNDTVIRLHPDRLNLSYQSKTISVVLGRQAIGFGNLLGYSPLDLIAPFQPLALDKDIRPGVDALKLEYYPGPLTTVTAIAVVPKESANQSFLLLYSHLGEKGDWNLLLGENKQKPALGLGYAQDVKGAGLRLEILGFGDERDGTQAGYLTSGIEVDYLWANEWYLDLELFFNGEGENDPAKYQLQSRDSFLAGRLYTFFNSRYELTPLLTLNLSALVNLQDDSFLISPRLIYSISNNSEVLAFYNLPFGRKPELDGTIRSEYGSSPRSAGLSLRLFF